MIFIQTSSYESCQEKTHIFPIKDLMYSTENTAEIFFLFKGWTHGCFEFKSLPLKGWIYIVYVIHALYGLKIWTILNNLVVLDGMERSVSTTTTDPLQESTQLVTSSQPGIDRYNNNSKYNNNRSSTGIHTIGYLFTARYR